MAKYKAVSAGRVRSMTERRSALMEALFKDRHYTVVSEVHLPEGDRFKTPLNNLGRHGVILQEVGTDYRIVVGFAVMRQAAEIYSAVTVPESRVIRRRRKRSAVVETETFDSSVMARIFRDLGEEK